MRAESNTERSQNSLSAQASLVPLPGWTATGLPRRYRAGRSDDGNA